MIARAVGILGVHDVSVFVPYISKISYCCRLEVYLINNIVNTNDSYFYRGGTRGVDHPYYMHSVTKKYLCNFFQYQSAMNC